MKPTLLAQRLAAGLLLTHAGLSPAAQPALIDDASLTLGTVLVNETSGPVDTRSLPTSVDILSRERIETQALRHNWELLGQMPGVMLTNFNQGNVSGKFSLRGFNGEGEINAVKLLIDGVPANSNDGNMPYLEMVLPIEIEAIEVVRGTNDPRYGLHNIAGNADVLTRSGGNYRLGRAGYGSFDSREVQAAAGIDSGSLTQNYAVGHFASGGYRDHGELEKSSFAGKWFVVPGDGSTRVGLVARHHEARGDEPGYLTRAQAEAEPSMSPAHSASDGGNRRLSQFSLHADGEPGADISWSARAYLNEIRDRRYVRFSAEVAQQERDTEERHTGALGTLTWRPAVSWAEEFALVGGLAVEHQDNRSERYTTASRVRLAQTRDQQFDFDSVGGFVQAVIKPTARFKLVPAYRIDRLDGDYTNRLDGRRYDMNDYGAIHQPKFSAVYAVDERHAVYANWGRTFQVGVGTGSYKVGQSEDLDPSINEGWELGYKFRPYAWLDGRIALWQQTATNEARRKLNDPANSTENIGKTRRRGLDLQLNAHATDQLALWFAVSLQRSKILRAEASSPASEGREIDHVPHFLANAGADYAVSDALSLSLWANAQGDYYLERTNSSGRFGRFLLLNASATYRIARDVRLELQLRNLADRDYEYVWHDGTQSLHSPGDPRSVHAAVQVSF